VKSQVIKTGVFVLGAVGLTVAAAWINPAGRRAEIFNDQGEPLFPKLRDVLAVKAIEVVDYDEAEAVARPFKVEMRRNRWIISSHYDYPAEARDRLAKTVAALVDLKKDLAVSDRVEDHAQYGVIDPLDQKVASLAGRGKRITLRDGYGDTLAEMVLGHAIKERAGYRYVRLPGQKRTYAVKTEADPSARFEDWVESDLLRISASQIRKITVNSYTINEQLGRIANAQRTVLVRDGSDWKAEGEQKPDRGKIQALVSTVDNLRIAGVRPKPAPLAAQLKSKEGLALTLEAVMSLRQRGFFITPDGRLLSNEGEVSLETDSGLSYTLRFGEIVTGAGEPAAKRQPKSGENRYLFVTVAGSDPRAPEISARFADWYYVISGTDFAKLRLQ
jgi:hypothetical protein